MLWLAQMVGFAGFGVMLVATQQRSADRLLALDVVGILTVSAHWILLGDGLAAALNSVFALISGLGLLRRRGSHAAAIAYWFLYPLTAAGFLAARSTPDLLATAGTLFAVAGIQQRSLFALRTLVVMSGICWLIFGATEGSVGQVVFGMLFVGGHLRQLKAIKTAPVTLDE